MGGEKHDKRQTDSSRLARPVEMSVYLKLDDPKKQTALS